MTTVHVFRCAAPKTPEVEPSPALASAMALLRDACAGQVPKEGAHKTMPKPVSGLQPCAHNCMTLRWHAGFGLQAATRAAVRPGGQRPICPLRTTSEDCRLYRRVRVGACWSAN